MKPSVLAIQKAKQSERGCFVTGVRVMFGHNVSKSNVKTQKIFKQNIGKKKMISPTLGEINLKISRRGERTILKYGGIDSFLRKYSERKMTLSALKLKSRLVSFQESSSKPHQS